MIRNPMPALFPSELGVPVAWGNLGRAHAHGRDIRSAGLASVRPRRCSSRRRGFFFGWFIWNWCQPVSAATETAEDNGALPTIIAQ